MQENSINKDLSLIEEGEELDISCEESNF